MVFRFPAAADRDRRRFVEFQNAGSDARDQMRAIAEGRIFCPRASAVGDACRYLSDNGGFDEIVVGEWHGTSFPGCKDEDYSQKLRVSTTVLGMTLISRVISSVARNPCFDRREKSFLDYSRDDNPAWFERLQHGL